MHSWYPAVQKDHRRWTGVGHTCCMQWSWNWTGWEQKYFFHRLTLKHGTKKNQSHYSVIKWVFVLSFILCKSNSLLSKLWTWKLWDFFLLLKESYIRQQTQSQLFRKRRLASSATSPVYLLSRCCCYQLQSFIFTSLQFSFGSCRLHFAPSFPLYTLWGNYCV